MSRTREDCGCYHNGSKWVTLCVRHAAEFLETHARWQAEHVQRQQQRDLDTEDAAAAQGFGLVP